MAAKHSHKKKQWPDSVLRFREKEEKFFSEKKRRIYIYINADKMYINVKKTF